MDKDAERYPPLTQVRLEQAGLPRIGEIQYFDETGSTNVVAMEWAERGAEEGSLVIADYQHAGRGRFERPWMAASGRCLLFSLILEPAWKADKFGVTNLAAAVALSHVMGQLGLTALVKWPNDLIIGDKKTAGILSEIPSGRSAALVLGVGVNVNIDELPEFSIPATSLAIEAGKPFDRLELLRLFLEHFWPLKAGPSESVLDHYRRLCATIGADVRIETGTRTFESHAIGIDDYGNLVLKSGEILAAGDVTHLRMGARPAGTR